jgi:hypothetical protein
MKKTPGSQESESYRGRYKKEGEEGINRRERKEMDW